MVDSNQVDPDPKNPNSPQNQPAGPNDQRLDGPNTDAEIAKRRAKDLEKKSQTNRKGEGKGSDLH